jgi:DNA-binding transcriptional ArsR family regulator
MVDDEGRITDLETLRVVAHPLRVRLYELLATRGPATATGLSAIVKIPTNTLSYHLRQLSAHGLVTEDDDSPHDGRERWWKASPGGLHWSAEDFPDSAGTRAVLRSAEHVIATRRVSRLRSWLDTESAQWGPDWAGAAQSTDAVLSLSVDELRQFGQEIGEVLQRWSDHSRASRTPTDIDSATQKARVFTFFHAFPVDE